MREKWLQLIALLTTLMILLLVMIFALGQNLTESYDATEETEQALDIPRPEKLLVVNEKSIKAGRQVYNQQGCALCHSIAGKGNTRNPLDGVGRRRTAEEINEWVVGADRLKGIMPERAFKFKKTYRELHSDDLKALVVYLQSLR